MIVVRTLLVQQIANCRALKRRHGLALSDWLAMLDLRDEYKSLQQARA